MFPGRFCNVQACSNDRKRSQADSDELYRAPPTTLALTWWPGSTPWYSNSRIVYFRKVENRDVKSQKSRSGTRKSWFFVYSKTVIQCSYNVQVRYSGQKRVPRRLCWRRGRPRQSRVGNVSGHSNMPGHYKNIQGTFLEKWKCHVFRVPDVDFGGRVPAYLKYLTNFQTERQNIKENQWRFYVFNKLDFGHSRVHS